MISIELSGRTAVVTGAASGIGRATADVLAAAGATVVGVDLQPADAAFPGVLLQGDVRDPDVRERALGRLAAGSPAILVNNAALQLERRLAETSPDDIGATLEVNVAAPALLAVAFSRIAAPGSAIVNVASVLGLSGDPALAAYSISKGAVVNLTRTLALDLAGRIRVNAVCPGAIRTPLTTRVWDLAPDPADAERRMIAVYPAGRIGEPIDVAHVIAFLASDLAAFVNGALMAVDGGLLAANAEWALERL